MMIPLDSALLRPHLDKILSPLVWAPQSRTLPNWTEPSRGPPGHSGAGGPSSKGTLRDRAASACRREGFGGMRAAFSCLQAGHRQDKASCGWMKDKGHKLKQDKFRLEIKGVLSPQRRQCSSAASCPGALCGLCSWRFSRQIA